MRITNRELVDNALKAAREGRLLALIEGANEDISYRNRDYRGCRCAIGASLPDDVLDALEKDGFNGQPVSDVPWSAYGVWFESRGFANDLQAAHDWFSTGSTPFFEVGNSINVEVMRMAIDADGEPEEMIAFLETLQKTLETA